MNPTSEKKTRRGVLMNASASNFHVLTVDRLEYGRGRFRIKFLSQGMSCGQLSLNTIIFI
jgi:hypothetical protein